VGVALNANVSPLSRELTIPNPSTMVRPPSHGTGPRSVGLDRVPQMPQKSLPLVMNYAITLGQD
jgi:hypothetical protein